MVKCEESLYIRDKGYCKCILKLNHKCNHKYIEVYRWYDE